ncbi:MAG: bifunctional metallophosphatase/5'-nucleotidase [Prevotella sp.]
MRTYILYILLCITTLLHAQERKELVILHTNDIHSTIEPLSTTLTDTMLQGRAGMARCAAMVEQERQLHPDLLLLDSGDFSQGSPYYVFFQGEVEVALMNLMDYDAATLGNHEFDYGMDTLAARLAKARYPIVCSNADFSDTPLKDIIKPYTVVKRDGVKIGIFGLLPNPKGLIFASNYKGMKYLDPVECTQKTVDILRRKEGCHIVICLSHLGWDMEPDFGDRQLISQCEGIDLLLGGHSHTYMQQMEWVDDRKGNAVGVDQNGKHAAFVGRIVMQLERKGKSYSK